MSSSVGEGGDLAASPKKGDQKRGQQKRAEKRKKGTKKKGKKGTDLFFSGKRGG